MARKKLGKIAALGGAALLASRMMGGKDKETKETKDTTADASAGMAKDRLGGIGLDRGAIDTSGDASVGMARDRLLDIERLNPNRYNRRRSQSGEFGTMKKGGVVKSSASKRADGVAIKGKTKGRFV